MRKPLYAITASELGLTPSTLESELERIFKLARDLDAVLVRRPYISVVESTTD